MFATKIDVFLVRKKKMYVMKRKNMCFERNSFYFSGHSISIDMHIEKNNNKKTIFVNIR